MPVVSVYLYDFGPGGPRYHGFTASAGRLCTVEAGKLAWREPSVLACRFVRVPAGCTVAGNFLLRPNGQGNLTADETLERAALAADGFAFADAVTGGVERESVVRPAG